MGWKKFIKKTIKRATRPVTKVFKGVAKGIAKVGKAVIRGVSKLSKKLGPLGMIALSIAMPYALSGLSSMTTGMMNYGLGTATPNTAFKLFVRSIGNVGNTIRTGYQAATGAISDTFSSITRSITKGFSDMGRGNNIFSRISNGAKELFKNARAQVQKFKPFTAKGGSVDVTGIHARGPASWNNEFMRHSMTNVQAEAALKAGVIAGDQLVGQSWGKTGWLTKANPMDKAIAETINKTYETNTMSFFDGNTKKAFLDYKRAADASGQKYNYQNIDTMMKDNFIINKDSGSIGFDFNRSGDYTYQEATMRANPHLESGQSIQDARYTFTGDKTFDNPVAKKFKYKDIINKAKKGTVKWVKDSLLKPVDWTQPKEYEFKPTTAAEFAGSTGAVLSATDIKGATGSSSYANVFGTAAWEKLKAYHKHMNYQGSQESTYT